MKLNQARALVTGANRGIGYAFAERLAKEPLAELLMAARSPAAMTLPTPPPGGAQAVTTVQLDLSSMEQIEHDVAVIEQFEAIDVLVNNAGLLSAGLLEQQDTAAIYAMMQVNTAAVIHLTKLVLPGMLERGSGVIVNNASISGYAYFPATSTYAASKAAVVAFSESLRRELRGTGVSVIHLVTPRIETDMAETMDDVYAGLVDTKDFTSTPAAEWADRMVDAIMSGKHIVEPDFRTRSAKLLSRGPARLLDAVSQRMFTRPQ